MGYWEKNSFPVRVGEPGTGCLEQLGLPLDPGKHRLESKARLEQPRTVGAVPAMARAALEGL